MIILLMSLLLVQYFKYVTKPQKLQFQTLLELGFYLNYAKSRGVYQVKREVPLYKFL